MTTGTFVEWVQLLPNIENLIRKGQSDSSIIETLDSVRFKFLASLLLMNKKSVLITGSSGIGKTVFIKSMLKSLSSTGFTYKVNSILGDIFNYSERKNQTSQDTVNSLFNEETESKKLKTDEFGKNFKFLGCFLNKFTFSL